MANYEETLSYALLEAQRKILFDNAVKLESDLGVSAISVYLKDLPIAVSPEQIDVSVDAATAHVVELLSNLTALATAAKKLIPLKEARK